MNGLSEAAAGSCVEKYRRTGHPIRDIPSGGTKYRRTGQRTDNRHRHPRTKYRRTGQRDRTEDRSTVGPDRLVQASSPRLPARLPTQSRKRFSARRWIRLVRQGCLRGCRHNRGSGFRPADGSCPDIVAADRSRGQSSASRATCWQTLARCHKHDTVETFEDA